MNIRSEESDDVPGGSRTETEEGLASLRTRLSERLFAEDRDDLSEPLDRCGETISLVCLCCAGSHLAENRCKRRYCPVCARMIAARFVSRYRSTLATIKWPLFTTWTAMHSELFPLSFPLLFDALKKVRRQKWFEQKVCGGIVSGEVVCNGTSGWHFHLHSVLDCRWLSVVTPAPPPYATQQLIKRRAQASMREVRDQWELALGRPGSLQSQRCNGEQAAREILKYAVTPGDLLSAPGEIGPIIDAIRKQRLVRSWGTMYGHLRDADEPLEKQKCEHCGQRAGQVPAGVWDMMVRSARCG